MEKIKNFFDQQEEVIYRVEKNWKLILSTSFLYLLGLFGIPSLFRLVSAVVSQNFTSGIAEDLAISAPTFLFGFALPILILILYLCGEIIVTNKKIYVKKGISGNLIIIPLENIAGIVKCDYSTRGFTHYYLLIHLLDGRKIKSDTHFSKDGVNKVEKLLLEKGINKFEFFKMKYEKYKKVIPDEILYFKYSIAPLLPVISALLFIIPILMFIVLFTKFN